jgi:hypothetical protein
MPGPTRRPKDAVWRPVHSVGAINVPSVFHYTDTAGLLGILASRCLLATDYRYLNDATEGSLIKDLIVPILESEITELIPKLVAKGLIKGFYEFHGASGHRSLAEGFYRSAPVNGVGCYHFATQLDGTR